MEPLPPPLPSRPQDCGASPLFRDRTLRFNPSIVPYPGRTFRFTRMDGSLAGWGEGTLLKELTARLYEDHQEILLVRTSAQPEASYGVVQVYDGSTWHLQDALSGEWMARIATAPCWISFDVFEWSILDSEDRRIGRLKGVFRWRRIIPLLRQLCARHAEVYRGTDRLATIIRHPRYFHPIPKRVYTVQFTDKASHRPDRLLVLGTCVVIGRTSLP